MQRMSRSLQVRELCCSSSLTDVKPDDVIPRLHVQLHVCTSHAPTQLGKLKLSQNKKRT